MVQESVMDSERLKLVAETLIRPSHEGTLVLIEKARRAIGLEEVDPIMLLYMITSVAQMPYLLTA